MALSSSIILSILELVIYLPSLCFTLYLLYKHRLPGLLGNLYLLAFLILRLATSGINISDRNKPASSTGAILNSIGVSPLLLTLAGYLHEAAHYSIPPQRKNKLLSFVLQLFFHFATIGGIALAAIGGSNLAKPESTTNKYSTDRGLRKGGSLIIFLVWILLCIYLFWVRRLTSTQSHLSTKATSSARGLWIFSAIAVPFVGIRVLYSIVYAFDSSPSVSPVTGTFAVRFCLIFLVQVFAALAFMTGGMRSRHIVNEAKGANGPPGSRQSEVASDGQAQTYLMHDVAK